jgi:type II secretory pathway component PulF
VFGVIIGIMMYSLPRWIGPTRARFDRFPPWSLYRLTNGSGFMLSTSALVKAGVQVPEILRILKKDATPWYDERISGALKHVSNGVNLGEALYRTKLGFPDTDTVMDLRSYAQMDGFDEKLELLGRQWVESSVERVKVQMAFFKNLSIIMLGVVFGSITVGISSLNLQLMNSASHH